MGLNAGVVGGVSWEKMHRRKEGTRRLFKDIKIF